MNVIVPSSVMAMNLVFNNVIENGKGGKQDSGMNSQSIPLWSSSPE